MGMTILKKKTGYALGLLLCILGGIMLLVVLWKVWEAWPNVSIQNFLEVKYADIALGIGLKLIHYTFIGIILLFVGGGILIVRRERVAVAEEVSVLIECPYCKNQWRESMSKPHLESMGYPKVRTLSRRKCAKCAKFIRPKIVATDV